MKAILFDLDGVLYQGGSPLTGAVEAFDWVRREDIDHLFLTDTSSRPRAAIRENLEGMGIRISVEEILTPPVAARDRLLSQGVSSVALLIPEATRGSSLDWTFYPLTHKRAVGPWSSGTWARAGTSPP